MAFNPAPSAWLGAGYSLGTNQVVFNTAAHGTPCLAELSNADGNATTGNIRSIAFAICEKMFKSWALTAVDSRPTRMTISRNTSEDASGNLVKDFTFRFYVSDNNAETVIAE